MIELGAMGAMVDLDADECAGSRSKDPAAHPTSSHRTSLLSNSDFSSSSEHPCGGGSSVASLQAKCLGATNKLAPRRLAARLALCQTTRLPCFSSLRAVSDRLPSWKARSCLVLPLNTLLCPSARCNASCQTVSL